MTTYYSPPVRWWLIACIALTVGMIALGGLTRLTDSGLSIVAWKPIHGTLPPLSATEWQEEFDAYRRIPEYQQINRGMSLEEFKVIFWWEYAHRLWGRVLGLVFVVPLLVFWARRQISGRFGLECLGIFALGGVQAFVGWFMVQSGLVGNATDVSPYRLMLHLWVALVIVALLTLQASRAWGWRKLAVPHRWLNGIIFPAWLFLTIGYGALVAGMDAGLAYISFPSFNGAALPESLQTTASWWPTLVNEPGAVQFGHRMAAYGTLILGFWSAWSLRRYYRGLVLAVLLVIQAGLGIATIVYSVPIALASLHQINAVLLWITAIVTSRQILLK
ncbi:MAG: COX15/CtaA family protein [Holosporales bacterium]